MAAACTMKKIKLSLDSSDDDEIDAEDIEQSLEISQSQTEIENANESTESLKITDLNDECLQRICQYFDLIDLANFAESNVRLASAAKYVFSQVHQTYRMYLKSSGDSIQIPECHPLIGSENYPITHRSVENIFKNFGKCMRRIKVIHSLVPFGGPHNYNLINLIGENCRNTLIELECFGVNAYDELNRYKKPFVRLERLIFTEIITRMSPAKSVAEMYPNLRSLEFHNVFHVFDFFHGPTHLPRLEHFGLFTFPYAKFSAEYIPKIQQLVAMNPSLRSLSLYDLKANLNQFTLEEMPNIVKLEIGGHFVSPRIPFNFGNLRSLKLIYSNENATGYLEWLALPTNLEQLEIIGFYIDDVLLNLVKTCPNLKVFTATIFEAFNVNNVVDIAKSLPLLEEVVFISKFKENPKSHVAFSAALKFMEHCPELRKATVAIQLDKKDVRFKINKCIFKESKEFLMSYKEKVKKSLTFDWWRWNSNHEVKTIDFLKGWQSGSCFKVSFEKN